MNIDVAPTPGYDEFTGFIFVIYLFLITFPTFLIISGWLGMIRTQATLNWKEKLKYLLIPLYLIIKNRNKLKDIRYIIWTFLHAMLIIDLISWTLYLMGFGILIYRITNYSIFPGEYSFYLNVMDYIIGDWSLPRIIPAFAIYVLFTLSFFINRSSKQEGNFVEN